MTRKQRQKQEKRRKQRVFFSILMILFTGIILTASTGFQISEDADNWKSIVTADNLKSITYDLGKNQFPSDIAPVSTVGAVSETGLITAVSAGTGKLRILPDNSNNINYGEILLSIEVTAE